MKFIQAHWKAIMPLVALAVTFAADHVADLDLSAQTATIITSILAVILVFLKANAPAEPKAADKDAGEIGIVELIIVVTGLLVLALSLGWLPR